MWERLRSSQLGVRFRRQAPIGPYFADFLSNELKLIVEIDGDTHAEGGTDMERTKYLEKLGFKVIRYWNADVFDRLEGVVDDLEKAIVARRTEQKD